MFSQSSSNYASLSDADLLTALYSDDEGSFAEIYQRYCYRLFTLAYQKLKSRETAEELVQDLFENLWNRRANHEIQQLEQYLFSALRYRIINYIKMQQVRSGYELYRRLHTSEADSTTENALALNELSAALRASVQRLPAKTREIFQLSRLEQYSVAEISGRVHLSEKAVEYHLTKSLKLLRIYLRDFLAVALAVFWHF
ncbi:sigma-70 family RNA polymerase sigma factor [Hymenobacter negativus]|uniref:Sigma-70 family RNA polymerase sigma factor n=1 Tax=Hymenobacter negativus TaxID=2795026 RepID=A0ABS3QII0_9BACT|nr:sigma-70 family RNA polymerase sigma factor [Hymenobacter negativus]MBO2011041.1 sigma-70 family RNA polymerase sigma factor [Hymenobacter negativus]